MSSVFFRFARITNAQIRIVLTGLATHFANSVFLSMLAGKPVSEFLNEIARVRVATASFNPFDELTAEVKLSLGSPTSLR
jgi:hypothetical protein